MYTFVNRYHNSICHIYYDKEGNKRISKHSKDLNLMLGIETNEESEWKDMHGKNIQNVKCDTLGEYYKFIRDYGDYEIIYGNINPVAQFISNKYADEDPTDFSHIKTFVVDIETTSIIWDTKKEINIGFDIDDATFKTYDQINEKYTKEEQEKLVYEDKNIWKPYNRQIFIRQAGFPDPAKTEYPIITIAIKNEKNGKYYICSTKDYDKSKTILDIDPKDIQFYKAKDEEHLFKWFISIMRKEQPDILIGWYSNNFDWPYIINRSRIVFGTLDEISKISPFGVVTCEKTDISFGFGDTEWRIVVGGITMLDYLKLYKKFIFTPREKYSLDFISQEELGSNKINYEEYGNLNDLWDQNPQLFMDYNIYDVELISMMDKKLNLLDILASLAYKAKCNFYDALGTVGIWDILIYNRLKKNKIMIPPVKENETEQYAGAYVKQPVPDIYSWILSLDLNSLYPWIQKQFNISPECLTDEREMVRIDQIDDQILFQDIKPKEGLILAGNGCYFKKDKVGFIPELLIEIYDERKEAKKLMIQKKIELEAIENQLKEI